MVEGRLSVDVQGRRAPDLGPGAGFGEIALIRDIERTATVRAITDVTLLAIERGPFLAALTGQPRSGAMATGLADRRLAADRVQA